VACFFNQNIIDKLFLMIFLSSFVIVPIYCQILFFDTSLILKQEQYVGFFSQDFRKSIDIVIIHIFVVSLIPFNGNIITVFHLLKDWLEIIIHGLFLFNSLQTFCHKSIS
jgi:hypothetical protein